MGKLAELFQQADGGLSMMRLCVFFVVIVATLTWSRLCLTTGWIDPTGLAVLVGTVLGVKAVQAFGERPPEVSRNDATAQRLQRDGGGV